MLTVKDLLLRPGGKDDNKVQRRALLLHCAGSDVLDISMFCLRRGAQKNTRRPKKLQPDILSPKSMFRMSDTCSEKWHRIYVEVTIAKRNTAEVAIKSLENMFATHGLPWTVTRCSNHSRVQIIAETFKSFLQENGIEHRKTTPLWP